MKASEVPAGAKLRQRHRNNPEGEWQPLVSLAERLPQRVVEARVSVSVPLSRPEFGSFEELRWVRVEFGRGGARPGAGRAPGAVDRVERKSRKVADSLRKKEKTTKDIIKG